jgi:exodeoxyribonuclease VII large subunit
MELDGVISKLDSDEDIYSVHELNKEIKQLLRLNFDSSIKVEGEISNFKFSNGNIFMSLKDQNSKISAIAWRYAKSIEGLKDGKQVIITGSVTSWDKQGSYQLTCYDIKIKGMGDLHSQFIKIRDKYQKKGYFNDSIKKKMIPNPKKIGVITAKSGAALKDFLYVLEKNNFNGNVIIANSLVQGLECPKMVSTWLKKLDKMNLDVIVITRGGGSYEDLFGFSDPLIIEGIYKCKTCVISAIGHEVDSMLSDYVSDIRAPTPSVAGEVIALHQQKIIDVNELNELCHFMENDLRNAFHQYQLTISKLNELIDSPEDILESYIGSLEFLLDKTELGIRDSLSDHMIKIRELNMEIDSNNPQLILNNGFVMIVDEKRNDMIKSGEDLEFLKDMCVNKKMQTEKLKIVFKDSEYLVNIQQLKKL